MPDARRHDRRYLIRLTLALVGYGLLLALALAVHRSVPSPWDLIVMLAPTPALLAVAWAVWRYLREADEMLRRDVVESMAIAFGLGSILTFGYGLLQVAGAPQAPWLGVWVVYGGCWLLARLGLTLTRR